MPEYITKEGMNRIQKRMAQLIKERPEIIKQVVTAREMGDLSENAEYHAARERQKHLENEFNNLKNRVSKLQVIDTDKISKNQVRFGARVTLQNIDNEQIRKIRIVGVDEVFSTDEEFERMSYASPIGRAIVGKKINDISLVKAPIGDKKYRILNIE